MTDSIKLDREYKSNIFHMIFSESTNFLSLYNAVNHSNYTDVSKLEVKTLQGAIYVSYKNDVSYLVDQTLSLYEHQSTYNPNMPLRSLFYISAQLSAYTRDANLFGTKLIKIPNPRFVCFYNGEKKIPDHQRWNLSDCFEKPEIESGLELVVDVYNINAGHNEEIMIACKKLNDYAIYVQRVREYAKTVKIEEAVERAIDECIHEDILADFLKENRAEAKAMSIYEYDEEKRIQKERQDAREEGREEGSVLKLVTLISKKIQKSKTLEVISDELECEVDEIQELYDAIYHCGIDCKVEDIMAYLREKDCC